MSSDWTILINKKTPKRSYTQTSSLDKTFWEDDWRDYTLHYILMCGGFLHVYIQSGNESHLSITTAQSAVTRVTPFVKLNWDHGNIQLSLCSCQCRSYRSDGYLLQKGRFNIPNTAWKNIVRNPAWGHILIYSMDNCRDGNDTFMLQYIILHIICI